MTDLHLINKIQTCTSLEELYGIRDGYRIRGEKMPGEALAALYRRVKELGGRG